MFTFWPGWTTKDAGWKSSYVGYQHLWREKRKQISSFIAEIELRMMFYMYHNLYTSHLHAITASKINSDVCGMAWVDPDLFLWSVPKTCQDFILKGLNIFAPPPPLQKMYSFIKIFSWTLLSLLQFKQNCSQMKYLRLCFTAHLCKMRHVLFDEWCDAHSLLLDPYRTFPCGGADYPLS